MFGALALIAIGCKPDVREVFTGLLGNCAPVLAKLADLSEVPRVSRDLQDQLVCIFASEDQSVLSDIKESLGLDIVRVDRNRELKRTAVTTRLISEADQMVALRDIYRFLDKTEPEILSPSQQTSSDDLLRKMSGRWRLSDDLGRLFMRKLGAEGLRRVLPFETRVYCTEPGGRQLHIPRAFEPSWRLYLQLMEDSQLLKRVEMQEALDSRFWFSEKVGHTDPFPRAVVVKLGRRPSSLLVTTSVYSRDGLLLDGSHQRYVFAPALDADGASARLERALTAEVELLPMPQDLQPAETILFGNARQRTPIPTFPEPLLPLYRTIVARLAQSGDYSAIVLQGSDFHIRPSRKCYGTRLTVRQMLEFLGEEMPLVIEEKRDVLVIRPRYRILAEKLQSPRSEISAYLRYLEGAESQRDLYRHSLFAARCGNAIHSGLWGAVSRHAAEHGIVVYSDPPFPAVMTFLSGLTSEEFAALRKAGDEGGACVIPSMAQRLGTMLDSLWPWGAPSGWLQRFETEPSRLTDEEWRGGGISIDERKDDALGQTKPLPSGDLVAIPNVFWPQEVLSHLPWLADRAKSGEDRLNILLNEFAFFVGDKTVWVLKCMRRDEVVSLTAEISVLKPTPVPGTQLRSEIKDRLRKALEDRNDL